MNAKQWKSWTPAEQQIVREHYPGGGSLAVAKALLERGFMRSRPAINSYAKQAGISTSVMRGGRRNDGLITSRGTVDDRIANSQVAGLLSCLHGFQIAHEDSVIEITTTLDQIVNPGAIAKCREAVTQLAGAVSRQGKVLTELRTRISGEPFSRKDAEET